MINCGVYIFSADMLKKDFYKELENKYRHIIETNKDDH
jgi:predicted secreted protein